MRDQEIQLSNYCRWDDSRNFAELLKKHSDLDVTIKNGLCFIYAIKHKNSEILKSLLDYYEKTNLKDNYDSMEYKTAKHALRQILEEAIEQYPITSEIEDILKPYVTTDEYSTEDIESLKDDAEASYQFDDPDITDLDNGSNPISLLTLANLRDWNNYNSDHQAQQKLIGTTDTAEHEL